MLDILALPAADSGRLRTQIGYLGAALLTVGRIAPIFNDWRAKVFGLVIVLAVLAENVLRGRRPEVAPVRA